MLARSAIFIVCVFVFVGMPSCKSPEARGSCKLMVSQKSPKYEQGHSAPARPHPTWPGVGMHRALNDETWSQPETHRGVCGYSFSQRIASVLRIIRIGHNGLR